MRIEKKKIEKIEREEEVGRYDEENGNWEYGSAAEGSETSILFVC